MLDGIYVKTLFRGSTFKIERKIVYISGVKIYDNTYIVDLKSDLSEEFKEKLKEHQ
jgi:hypothetical protein